MKNEIMRVALISVLMLTMVSSVSAKGSGGGGYQTGSFAGARQMGALAVGH